MSRKTVSLRDLAYALNISVSTVSRALKDHPDISRDVKARVQALARKMNYTYVPVASDEKRTATKAIGVIVPNMERNFYASVISGIENFAKQNGYFIIVTNSRESYENEVSCVQNLIKLRVDGLIVCLTQETSDYSHFDKARQTDIPIVFFDRVCRTNEFSSVIADNSDAAMAITQHLVDTGSSKIAHIAGPQKLSITKERVEGYKRGLEGNQLILNESHLVYSDMSPEGTKEAVLKLLQTNPVPDAIFCVNDTVAYVAMKEIKKQGFRIPEDISVTGFNNEFHSTIVEPALTTILHPTIELGEESARLIISQIASEYPHAPRQIVMKTNLIVRESSIKNIKKFKSNSYEIEQRES